MKSILIYTSLLTLLLGVVVAPGWALTHTISDGTFSDNAWEADMLYDTTGDQGAREDLYGPAVGTANQDQDIGDPASSRKSYIEWLPDEDGNQTDDGLYVFGHIYTTDSYNPTVLGEINSINYSFDVKVDYVDWVGGMNHGLLIKQGESYYRAAQYHYQASWTNWTTHSGTVGTVYETDETVFYGDGTGLDLSESGAPIYFGYYQLNSGSFTNGPSDIHWLQATGYLDNFNVSIDYTPIPEPTTMLLLGTGLIGLAGARRKFRK